MVPWLKKHGWQLLGGLLAIYVLFVIDFNGHSLASHVVRISSTSESHELGDALVDKVVDIASETKRRVVSAFNSR